LSHLKNNNPSNLEFQMRIPVSHEHNILRWVLSKKDEQTNSKSKYIEKLIEMLRAYGACEKNVFSFKELDSLPLSGSTLDELASLGWK
jgi:hypothetical protein